MGTVPGRSFLPLICFNVGTAAGILAGVLEVLHHVVQYLPHDLCGDTGARQGGMGVWVVNVQGGGHGLQAQGGPPGLRINERGRPKSVGFYLCLGNE